MCRELCRAGAVYFAAIPVCCKYVTIAGETAVTGVMHLYYA